MTRKLQVEKEKLKKNIWRKLKPDTLLVIENIKNKFWLNDRKIKQMTEDWYALSEILNWEINQKWKLITKDIIQEWARNYLLNKY